MSQPQRLPNEDLHYIINAFNRPNDPPVVRLQANASFFPFDQTGSGSYAPSDLKLHLSVHIDRDTPKELVREVLKNMVDNLDELYKPLAEMRERWENGDDPERPIIAYFGLDQES